jgi:hypothetical protein
MAAEPLNQAAAARRARTLARTEQALGELEAEGAAVSFQAVAHWSSSCVPAGAGTAPRSLARAEGHDETSASRRSVEVP